MAKRYEPTFFSEDHRYSMGNDLKTGGHYLAIPVSNGIVEYNEQYWLEPGQYDEFVSNPSVAARFVDECRARRHDDQLIYVPSEKRGEPI